MRFLHQLLAALFFAVNASPAPAEQIAGSRFVFGNWSGAAYTNDDTGRFSQCIVSADYKSGDTLFLSVTDAATVVIGVSNPSFRFNSTDTFPVEVRIDSRAPFFARLNTISQNTAAIEIDDFERAMTAIQRGRTMRIEGAGFRGIYDLSGTMRALDQALRCAYDYYEFTGTPSESGQPSTSALDQAFLYQIATEMITTVGASDFRYLSIDEYKELGFEHGVFWVSQALGMLGGVMAVSAPEGSIRDTDSSDISFMNRFCDGDFASSSEQVEPARAEQRQLTGFCLQNNSKSQFIVLKTRHGDAVLYNIMHFDSDNSFKDAQRNEVTRDIALRAASYPVAE